MNKPMIHFIDIFDKKGFVLAIISFLFAIISFSYGIYEGVQNSAIEKEFNVKLITSLSEQEKSIKNEFRIINNDNVETIKQLNVKIGHQNEEIVFLKKQNVEIAKNIKSNYMVQLKENENIINKLTNEIKYKDISLNNSINGIKILQSNNNDKTNEILVLQKNIQYTLDDKSNIIKISNDKLNNLMSNVEKYYISYGKNDYIDNISNEIGLL